MEHKDDILALATPLGQSALAIIRTSGQTCIRRIASSFSRPHAVEGAAGHSIVYGWLRSAEENLDEVTLAIFRAPKSYTGEDSVEIHCHGSIPGIRTIISHLLKRGFRQAEPGEFTLRAVLNGKIDLSQAEAVGEIIHAQGTRAQKGALKRLAGAVYTEINAIKHSIADMLASAQVMLDYPEEELPNDAQDSPSDMSAVLPLKTLDSAISRLQGLARSYDSAQLYREGARVVLAGRTNAGKSSLFNRLLREERAIVSAKHGTTRDYLEAHIELQGIPLQIYDTAGLRDISEEVEEEGMRRTQALVESAEILLYLEEAQEDAQKSYPLDQASQHFGTGNDGSARAGIHQQKKQTRIQLWTKCDLPTAPPAPEGFLAISAKTGRGIPELGQRIFQALSEGVGGAEDSGLLIESLRQRDLILTAAGALRASRQSVQDGFALDVVALDLQDAVHTLGQLTGEVRTDDILDRIFSKFCVGK